MIGLLSRFTPSLGSYNQNKKHTSVTSGLWRIHYFYDGYINLVVLLVTLLVKQPTPLPSLAPSSSSVICTLFFYFLLSSYLLLLCLGHRTCYALYGSTLIVSSMHGSTRRHEQQREGNFSSHDFAKERSASTALLKIYGRRGKLLHRRANSNWLLKGDNNTEYFHIIINGKKRKNTIFCLQRENGNIEGDEQMSDHATQYYKNLFSPSSNSNIHLDPQCWDPGGKISRRKTKSLLRIFLQRKSILQFFNGKEHRTWASSFAH